MFQFFFFLYFWFNVASEENVSYPGLTQLHRGSKKIDTTVNIMSLVGKRNQKPH